MSRPLNTRQKKFVDNYVIKGLSIAESVRRAGYSTTSGKIEDLSSYGCKLLRQDRVKTYVQKLKSKQFKESVLSVEEKRSFLARAVRADASNPDPDLVQELVETHGEHGSVKRVKLVSKLEAINIDNKMAGDNYSDRTGADQVNPFSFIVQLFSPGSAGSLPAVPAVPVQASLPTPIDAEIVQGPSL
jgi:phage terminase small subunit